MLLRACGEEVTGLHEKINANGSNSARACFFFTVSGNLSAHPKYFFKILFVCFFGRHSGRCNNFAYILGIFTRIKKHFRFWASN